MNASSAMNIVPDSKGLGLDSVGQSGQATPGVETSGEQSFGSILAKVDKAGQVGMAGSELTVQEQGEDPNATLLASLQLVQAAQMAFMAQPVVQSSSSQTNQDGSDLRAVAGQGQSAASLSAVELLAGPVGSAWTVGAEGSAQVWAAGQVAGENAQAGLTDETSLAAIKASAAAGVSGDTVDLKGPAPQVVQAPDMADDSIRQAVVNGVEDDSAKGLKILEGGFASQRTVVDGARQVSEQASQPSFHEQIVEAVTTHRAGPVAERDGQVKPDRVAETQGKNERAGEANMGAIELSGRQAVTMKGESQGAGAEGQDVADQMIAQNLKHKDADKGRKGVDQSRGANAERFMATMQADSNGPKPVEVSPARPVAVTLPAEPAKAVSLPSIHVDVNPGDLGRVSLRVTLADQTVHANVQTERTDLRNFLVGNQSRLEAGLNATGLQMGEFRVSADADGRGHQDMNWLSYGAGQNAYGQGRGAQEQQGQGQYGRGHEGAPESVDTAPRYYRASNGLSLFA